MDRCRPYSRGFIFRSSAIFHIGECVRHNVYAWHIGRNTDAISDNHCICNEYCYGFGESHKHVGICSAIFYVNIEAQVCIHFHLNSHNCHRHSYIYLNSNIHFDRHCRIHSNSNTYPYKCCHIHINTNIYIDGHCDTHVNCHAYSLHSDIYTNLNAHQYTDRYANFQYTFILHDDN